MARKKRAGYPPAWFGVGSGVGAFVCCAFCCIGGLGSWWRAGPGYPLWAQAASGLLGVCGLLGVSAMLISLHPPARWYKLRRRSDDPDPA